VFVNYCAVAALPTGTRLLLLLCSVLLAVLSWKFVETPFRTRVVCRTPAQVFSFAGVTAAALLLIGLTIMLLHGAPARMPAAALQFVLTDHGRPFMIELSLRRARAHDFIELGRGDKKQPVDLFVWGDSHARAAMPAFDYLCKQYGIRGLAATHAMTPPIINYEFDSDSASLQHDSIAYSNAIVDYIRSRHIRHVVLLGYWQFYIDNDGSARIRRGLLETMTALQDAGAQVWLMRDVPIQANHNPPALLARAVVYHRDPDTFGISLSELRKSTHLLDPLFAEITARFPCVTVLDPTACFVTPHGICRMAKNGRSLYRDYNHLTNAGAMELCPLLQPLFANISSSIITAKSGY
jgi:hypothetical protein